MVAKSEKRFLTVFSEGNLTGFRVIKDTETGVNYLFVWDGPAGGLTALLDKDGKPVISSD